MLMCCQDPCFMTDFYFSFCRQLPQNVSFLKFFISDVRFEYIVDQQPIGRLLFRQWCEKKRPEYYRYITFLDACEQYELETDEQRIDMATSIKKQFMQNSDEGLEVFMISELNTNITLNNKLSDGHKDLFLPCVTAVKSCLAGQPFCDFQSSIYFHRYLQWKWLEAQPVTYKTFRMYRVLGKGGFGEVCACQVITSSHYFYVHVNKCSFFLGSCDR